MVQRRGSMACLLAVGLFLALLGTAGADGGPTHGGPEGLGSPNVTLFAVPVAAQSRIPPVDLVGLATCLERQMGDALSDPLITITEQAPGTWRLTLALRGQPTSDQGVQSPPPSQPTTSYIDLAAAASRAELPPDLEPFSN